MAEVKLARDDQTSDAMVATMQSFAPALFSFDGKYLAATSADNSFLGERPVVGEPGPGNTGKAW